MADGTPTNVSLTRQSVSCYCLNMPNRNLTPEQLEQARRLLQDARLTTLADGDVELLFAYRRKIAKEQGAPLTLQGPGAADPATSQAAGRPEVEGCRLNFISLTCRSRMRSSAFGRDVLFAVRP